MVRPSADQFLEPADLPHFEAGQWLLTCSIALANEPVRTSCLHAMAAIKAAGGRVCFDPNLRPEVWGKPAEMLPQVSAAIALADVVKLSIEELQLLSGEDDLAAGLATLSGPALVLVTRGRPVWWPVWVASSWVGRAKVTPLDTTGRGMPSSPGSWPRWHRASDCPRWPSCPSSWPRLTAAGRSPPPPRGP